MLVRLCVYAGGCIRKQTDWLVPPLNRLITGKRVINLAKYYYVVGLKIGARLHRNGPFNFLTSTLTKSLKWFNRGKTVGGLVVTKRRICFLMTISADNHSQLPPLICAIDGR